MQSKKWGHFRNLQMKGFPIVILLLFLYKNLIDLERFVNLAILQNIPNFKSIYNNLQKYDLFEIYHGLSDDHGELKSKISSL